MGVEDRCDGCGGRLYRDTIAVDEGRGAAWVTRYYGPECAERAREDRERVERAEAERLIPVATLDPEARARAAVLVEDAWREDPFAGGPIRVEGRLVYGVANLPGVAGVLTRAEVDAIQARLASGAAR